MKLLTLLIYLLFSINLLSQNFCEKSRLKRLVKATNNSDSARVTKLKNKIDIGYSWPHKYQLLYSYSDHINYISEIGKSIEIDSLSQTKTCLDRLSIIVNEYSRSTSDSLFALDKKCDVNRIAAAYNMVYRTYNNQYLIDSLDNQVRYKKEFQNPHDLDSLFETELPNIIDSLSIDPKMNSEETDYLIVIERAGENGEDIVIKLDLYYKEDNYGYPLGYYKSAAIDYPIKIFSTIVKGMLRISKSVKTSITGEADSHRPNGLIYQGELNEIKWNRFHIKPGQQISNLDLAFLRAYNASIIFKNITTKNILKIYAIDHLDISGTNKGAEYRRIEMTAYFYGYYTEEYERMSGDAKQAIKKDNRVIKIKKNKISRE